MTGKLLADVSTTLADVQADLQRILPSNAVLCGHSLNNDFVALKVCLTFAVLLL